MLKSIINSKNIDRMKKIPSFAFSMLFVIQIIMQSIPIEQKIIINGDAMCTCGCGHTISICASNHSSNSKCSCNHDKEEETKVKFSPNTINDFVITHVINYNVIQSIEQLFNNLCFPTIEIIIDTPVPPPKFHTA